MSPSITQAKILLFDSNGSFMDLFKVLLNKIGIDEIFSPDSLQEANQVVKNHCPDICILDIEDANSMKSSLDLATNIRESGHSIPIIFLVPNAHRAEEYEKKIASYKYSGVLSKDLSPFGLLQAIKYALLQLENSLLMQKNRGASNLPSKVQMSPEIKGNKEQLFFKIGDSFKAIDKGKICFFYAENKLTYARVGRRNFPTNVQLKTLESNFFPCFIRCHKKYIVNVSQIESICTKNDKVMINNEVLPIGYSYRKSLLNSLSLLK